MCARAATHNITQYAHVVSTPVVAPRKWRFSNSCCSPHLWRPRLFSISPKRNRRDPIYSSPASCGIAVHAPGATRTFASLATPGTASLPRLPAILAPQTTNKTRARSPFSVLRALRGPHRPAGLVRVLSAPSLHPHGAGVCSRTRTKTCRGRDRWTLCAYRAHERRPTACFLMNSPAGVCLADCRSYMVTSLSRGER